VKFEMLREEGMQWNTLRPAAQWKGMSEK